MTALEDKLGALRETIDASLLTLLSSSAPLKTLDAARSAVLAPGKRIRPLLVLLVAEHLGCDAARAGPAACAVELVHAASLVLDDLPCMDDADTRRGMPALHRIYGEDVALLAAITLLNEAYGLLAGAGQIPADRRVEWAAVLAEAIGPLGLVAGQEQDLKITPTAGLDDVRALHRRKTAALFQAAAEMGAIAAGAGRETRSAARRFGEAIGLALQALDDLDDAADAVERERGSSLIAVVGVEGARQEARSRLSEAGSALRAADDRLEAMAAYVELLLAPVGRKQ